MADDFVKEELTRKMTGVAIDLQEALKDKLTQERGKFTGYGQASIRVVFTGSGLEISMAEYLKYIEFGIPNATTGEDLEDWVEKKMLADWRPKPIRGVSASEQKAHKVKMLSNAIAEHITKFGPRPYPFIRTTLNNDLGPILKKNFAS